MTASAAERRRHVVVAGHTGDVDIARSALHDDDAGVRAAALAALARLDELDDDTIAGALGDPSPVVRRRAVRLTADRPHLSLSVALADDDDTVVEVAAWACGEHERVDDDTLHQLMSLATGAGAALVREAAAAALGAIGDPRSVSAILHACADKPHVRRRAVLALAPFEGDEVEAAIDRALADRDWQVRQAAEDLRRAAGTIDTGEPNSPF